ncbi:MAG: formimidoylglutamate deiminase [Acidimicrobiia bacterium]|nr:formimidoylglutamate deiminase [Acidimicrobiia bacterium]
MRRLCFSAGLVGGELVRDVTIEHNAGLITDLVAGEPSHGTSVAGILAPPFVNGHSHAFHRALRGKTHRQGGDFWSWRDMMYRVAGELYPETYRRLAAGVFAEMLGAGITAVGEFHYLHHAAGGERFADPNAMALALVRAASDSGIRLTLIDTCYLSSDVTGSPVGLEQQRFSDGTVEQWTDRVRTLAALVADEPMVRLAVAPHSVRAVPAKDLPSIRAVADELDIPIHVHVSEQPAENEACVEEHGITPVELLVETGVLGPRSTAVHATHLTERDIELLAASGAGVCLCPTTERDLADGLGPAAELQGSGVPLSLGTDSNAVIDMFEEARGVELHDRLRTGRRGVHQGATLLDAATQQGAVSIGWPEIGSLNIGSAADFVVIDPSSFALAGADSLDGILFSATRNDVTDVYVGGTQTVAQRRHFGGILPTTLSGGLAAVTE